MFVSGVFRCGSLLSVSDHSQLGSSPFVEILWMYRITCSSDGHGLIRLAFADSGFFAAWIFTIDQISWTPWLYTLARWAILHGICAFSL